MCFTAACRALPTHLADALEDADGEDGREAAEVARADRRQDGQRRRPEDAEQQRPLAADLLGQHSAGNLRCHVAVEERRQDDALLLLVPDELTLT